MKDLIERLHSAAIYGPIPCPVYNEAADALEELAAALALRDEALEHHHEIALGRGRDMSHSLSQLIVSGYKAGGLCKITAEALAIQPHALLVNKIKADAVREAAKNAQNKLGDGRGITMYIQHIADRIEKGEA